MSYLEEYKDSKPECELEYFDKPTFDELQDIWKLSYNQNGELYEQQRRIDRRDTLKDLKTEGISPQLLFEKFGIANFERYWAKMLLENIHESEPNLIYMTSYYDHVFKNSGSLNKIIEPETDKKFLTQNGIIPKINYYEMGTQSQFLAYIEKIADPKQTQLLKIRTHAKEDALALGNYRQPNGYIHKRNLNGYNIPFNTNSTIIINGCEAGRTNGFAQALSKTTGSFVIACDEPLASTEIHGNHPIFENAILPLVKFGLNGESIKRHGIRRIIPEEITTRIYHSGYQL